MGQVKVMIVEDHPLMQMGIKKTLERSSDLHIVGEASTGKRAIEITDYITPDVIVMDFKLPDGDGVTTMKKIREKCRNTKVLMFSGFDDEQYVVKALENGADGYLLKNVGAAELVQAVHQVADGLNPISPQLTCKVMPIARKRMGTRDRLTPREKEIWKLLSKGASNHEISKELFVSESTVKFHVRNIFHKLGVKNRVEAARAAYDSIVA